MIGLLGFVGLIAGLRFGRGRYGPAWLFIVLIVAWWGVLVAVHSPMVSQPNRVAEALGGGFVPWVLLGVFAVPVIGYSYGLAALRRRGGRAVQAAVGGGPASFAPVELERYARHIMLREIGGAGQKRLKSAKVLVVGAGGLGSPVLLYLAASGVGRIGVIDADVVENSNLQRQVIHTDQRIGVAKAESAVLAMKALNPFIEARAYVRRLDEGAAALVAEYDLVLDGTDNFDTRYLVNRLAVAAGKPLIAAAITQWEGQISLYDPAQGGPCFECVFPHRPAAGLVPGCAEAGVAAPLPGIVGSMMAMEAVKHLTGAGETLRGRLMLYDALYAGVRVIGVKPRAGCETCGKERAG